MNMLTEETKKRTKALLGLIENLESKGAAVDARRSERAVMDTILKALQDLAPALWPQEAQVMSPVPDKVTFSLRAPFSGDINSLTFRYRADGIYFEDERLDHTTLTAENIQKLVLDKLTIFYSHVTEVTAT